jgi:hypothetical protein
MTRATVMTGNSMELLPTLHAATVQCCVTSPPYWELRDYDIPESEWPAVTFVPMAGLPPVEVPAKYSREIEFRTNVTPGFKFE